MNEGILSEKLNKNPAKESWQLSVRSILSELILNGTRPENLISQGSRGSIREPNIRNILALIVMTNSVNVIK
jgi:hypothetical protein